VPGVLTVETPANLPASGPAAEPRARATRAAAGWVVVPLEHRHARVAAGIVAVMQAAHEQEAQWLRRPSKPQHLPRVADIQASPCFHWGALAKTGQRLGGMEHTRAADAVAERAALEEASPLGVLVVGPDDEPGPLAIHTLVVHPAAQRQGIARALVQAALLQAPGAVFTVVAATGNTAALALYRSLGFVAYQQGVLGSAQVPIMKLRRPP
jgi:ribosomal protein S18 acetylase RimI-like enzyme